MLNLLQTGDLYITGGGGEYFNNEEKNKNDLNTAKLFWNKKKAGEALSWYIVNKGYNINNN